MLEVCKPRAISLYLIPWLDTLNPKPKKIPALTLNHKNTVKLCESTGAKPYKPQTLKPKPYTLNPTLKP